MLRAIELRHFKCFELLKLPLAPLTILSGVNASGKSSVLQALVLLHQTMNQHEWSTRLLLNGSALRAGTILDVVDKVNGRHSFCIAIRSDHASARWAFEGERGEMSAAVAELDIDRATQPVTTLRHLLPANATDQVLELARMIRCLSYIPAERVGPRELYSLEDRHLATAVGPAGENTAGVLHWRRDEQVISSLAIQDVPPNLLRQVEARMNEFFPGCGLDLQQIPNANSVALGVRTSAETGFHRPIHVGFGVTQVFPIVVAALSLRAGDLLLIENPEIHLHPGGQALMGEFLANVANAGVQVVVETHSDHILNGIRRAVKARQLPATRTALHFFRARAADAAQVVSPILDDQGNIDHWPDGFFDQFDKDMNHFAGWDS